MVIIICLVFFSFNNKFELVDQSSKVRIVLFDSAVAASSFKGKQWVIGVVSLKCGAIMNFIKIIYI